MSLVSLYIITGAQQGSIVMHTYFPGVFILQYQYEYQHNNMILVVDDINKIMRRWYEYE